MGSVALTEAEHPTVYRYVARCLGPLLNALQKAGFTVIIH